MYELSLEMNDLVNASSILDRMVVSSSLNATEKSGHLMNICAFELESSMYHEARRSCLKAVEYAPDSIAALVMAADVEKYLGNYTFASAYYRRALNNVEEGEGDERRFSTAEISHQLGSAFTLLGEHSEAEEYFKMSVGSYLQRKTPISPLSRGTPSYVHLGKHFLTTGRENQAMAMFQKALEINSNIKASPPPSSWNFAVGMTYAATSAYTDAYNAYSKVVKSADEKRAAGDSEEYKVRMDDASGTPFRTTLFHVLTSVFFVPGFASLIALLVSAPLHHSPHITLLSCGRPPHNGPQSARFILEKSERRRYGDWGGILAS